MASLQVLCSVILEFGFIRNVVPQQGLAVVAILLILAAYLTYYHVAHHQSFINPPLDGFIIGFGWVFGILSLQGILFRLIR